MALPRGVAQFGWEGGGLCLWSPRFCAPRRAVREDRLPSDVAGGAWPVADRSG